MSLDDLLQQHRKTEVRIDREPSAEKARRPARIFSTANQRGVNIQTAEAEENVRALMEWESGRESGPNAFDVDGLIDVFDPSEPPGGREDREDPMAELLKAEMAVVRPVAKAGMKFLSYLYAPLNRGFKFMTNALMYDPLTKSATGPVRKMAVQHAIDAEKRRQIGEAIDKKVAQRRKEDPIGSFAITFKSVLSEEEVKEINDRVDADAVGIIKQANAEPVEGEQVTAGDFGESAVNALKALIPWPGAADEVKTFGDISADSYERIIKREAPWYYAPAADIIGESVAMGGLIKIASASTSLAKSANVVKDVAAAAKLTVGEMRAIRKLHKAAARVKPVAPAVAGVPTAEQASSVTAKLVQLIKEAKPLRNKKALLVHRNRQAKARKLAQVQKNVQGERLLKSTKGALKGKSASPDFTPINTEFTGTEIDALFDMVNTSGLSRGFDKGNATIALDKLLKGTLITKSEIVTLEKVFGKQLTKALFGKQSVASIIQDVSFEVINLPRAILASYDLSAPGRQGIIFSVSHPVASTKAFGRAVRASVPFSGAKYADEIEAASKATKFGRMADNFGVHSSPTGFAANISAKEEVYLSRLAEKIPGVAMSERGFTTFLNQQRRLVFEAQAKQWIRKGITPQNDTRSFEQYAKFINHATGRGSLESLQPGALTAMNAVFFSPRLQASRVQVIGDLISPKTTSAARKVIARDLAEFYSTGLGIMAMAKAGGAEVEMDPRSSDFGKIKVGNTRYNYWGPFQPLATLAGRMYTGEIKSTGTGKIKKADRVNLGIDNVLGNFLRGKLAPVPGKFIDVIKESDILGRPVEPTKEFTQRAVFESLTPLFIQDSIDAWKFREVDGQFPVSAGLAFTGIGVQTWELSPSAELQLEKDSLSRQTFGKNADELSFDEANALDADITVNQPGIKELERQTRFDKNNVAVANKVAKELRKSELFLEKNIDKDLLADLNQTKIRLGGVDRIFGSWRLNDKQYREYQKLVAKNINEMFEDFRPLWDEKGVDPDFRANTITQILNSAKQKSAVEMKIGSME